MSECPLHRAGSILAEEGYYEVRRCLHVGNLSVADVLSVCDGRRFLEYTREGDDDTAIESHDIASDAEADDLWCQINARMLTGDYPVSDPALTSGEIAPLLDALAIWQRSETFS